MKIEVLACTASRTDSLPAAAAAAAAASCELSEHLPRNKIGRDHFEMLIDEV